MNKTYFIIKLKMDKSFFFSHWFNSKDLIMYSDSFIQQKVRYDKKIHILERCTKQYAYITTGILLYVWYIAVLF